MFHMKKYVKSPISQLGKHGHNQIFWNGLTNILKHFFQINKQ